MSSIYIKKTYIYLTLLIILISQYQLSAQNHSPTPQGYIPDTTIIEYYSISDIDKRKPYIDTLFDDLEKYVAARRFREGALTLGNQGSAAQKIIYTGRKDIYTDIGYHQYDIYRKSIFELPIYEANRTFNDLYFSPSDGSENFIVGAKFSRSFADNVEFSLDSVSCTHLTLPTICSV